MTLHCLFSQNAFNWIISPVACDDGTRMSCVRVYNYSQHHNQFCYSFTRSAACVAIQWCSLLPVIVLGANVAMHAPQIQLQKFPRTGVNPDQYPLIAPEVLVAITVFSTCSELPVLVGCNKVIVN